MKSIVLICIVLNSIHFTANASTDDITVGDLVTNVNYSMGLEMAILNAKTDLERQRLSKKKDQATDSLSLKIQLSKEITVGKTSATPSIVYKTKTCSIEVNSNNFTNKTRNLFIQYLGKAYDATKKYSYSGKVISPEEAPSLGMINFRNKDHNTGDTTQIQLVCYNGELTKETTLKEVREIFNDAIEFSSILN